MQYLAKNEDIIGLLHTKHCMVVATRHRYGAGATSYLLLCHNDGEPDREWPFETENELMSEFSREVLTYCK
jgi:hypothetical protein